MRAFARWTGTIGFISVCFWMFAGSASARAGSVNMEIIGEKARADRKLIVAENLALTDAEAKNFWRVYDRYVKDIGAIGSCYATLIQSYADTYRTMSDATARTPLDDCLACEAQPFKLQQDDLPQFRSVLPDKRATRYDQVENKIRTVMTYEPAKTIPLVDQPGHPTTPTVVPHGGTLGRGAGSNRAIIAVEVGAPGPPRQLSRRRRSPCDG